MIWVIIVSCLFIIGIIFTIIAVVNDWEEISSLLIIVETIISGISFFAIGISIICTHLPSDTAYIKNSLDAKIEELSATKASLDAAYDRTNDIQLIYSITDYNAQVTEFKTDIRDRQYALNNPWTNWFVNPVYNDYSADMVEYFGK